MGGVSTGIEVLFKPLLAVIYIINITAMVALENLRNIIMDHLWLASLCFTL